MLDGQAQAAGLLDLIGGKTAVGDADRQHSPTTAEIAQQEGGLHDGNTQPQPQEAYSLHSTKEPVLSPIPTVLNASMPCV